MANNHDSNRIKPAFRTTGALTGNFGRQKVKSGSGLNDVPANQRDSLGNFPRAEEYAARLREAYSKTSDHKLRAFILSELGKLERQRIGHEERYVKPLGAFCSISNHSVSSSQL